MNESKRMSLEYLKQQEKLGIKYVPRTHVHCGKWGLSQEILAAALKRLNGHCSLCGKKIYLILDHDHKTKKARGYICQRCNILVAGHENKQLNVKIEQYLDKPPLSEFYN